MHMSEPQIRYAIDPDTRSIVDVQAGFLPKKPYECIKCGGRLVSRQGDYLIWHFAHYGDEEAKNCPLYYGGHYEDLLKDLRTSEIEALERERSFRVVAIPSPYGRSLRICGVLPTIDWDELPDGTKVSSLLVSMTFETVGTRTPPVSDLFHPRNAEVLVELDPTAEEYEIQIYTQHTYPALTGRWTCDSLHEGDVFAGESERAERTKKVNSLNRGDTIFVFTRSEPGLLPDETIIYRAGPWYIVSFDLDQSTASLLEKFSGVKWQNPHSFYADVVLPPEADPRSHSPIIGAPGSTVIVAIFPPSDMDPEFEILSIPLKKGLLLKLPQTGQGKPRWYRTKFPDGGSQRLSINWADRHRFLHVHASPPTSSSMDLRTSLATESLIGIECNQEEATKLVESWATKPIRLKVREDARSLTDWGITPVFPPGFRFDVVALFEKESDIGRTVRHRRMEFEDLNQEFRGWVREGLREVVMDFKALGSIRLDLEPTKSWEKDLTKTEIKEHLRKLEELPRKARWPLVREVCGAPPGISHSEFPDGIKKLVRQAFKEVRDERQQ
jgi:hypothetical protein